MRGQDRPEINKRLCLELRHRLRAEGWTVRERGSYERPVSLSAGFLPMFVCSLGDEFTGIAVFRWIRKDESPPLDIVGHIAVAYVPAQKLLMAITGSEILGTVLKRPTTTVTVSSENDVSQSAEELAKFVSKQVPRLRELSNVNTLVGLLCKECAAPLDTSGAEIGSLDDPHVEHNMGQLVPALLAGSGSYARARQTLGEYTRLSSDKAWSPREYRRFVRQLTRMLDLGSEYSLPTTPPRWPAHPAKPEPPQSFRQVFSERRPEVRARQEAIAAVREVSRGKTRDELRTLLAHEFDQREVNTDPDSFDATLDLLETEQKSLGKMRIAIHAGQALWRAGRSSRERRSLRDQREMARQNAQGITDFDLEPEPLWLKLPNRAAYPIWSIGERMAAIKLDVDGRALLDRIMQDQSLGASHTRFVEVWFTRSAGSAANSSSLNVHIGEQCIGQLDVDASEHLRPAMEAAVERDEDPWMTGRLRRNSGGTSCVLEIVLPEPCEEIRSA